MSNFYLNQGDLDHLQPGVLDDAAAEFFANGHCASMALALHRLTGWPIYRFSHDGCYYGHAVVRPELGCYVDAQGPGAWFRFQAGHGVDNFRTTPLSPCDLSCAEPNLELVLPFATALLQRYFPELQETP